MEGRAAFLLKNRARERSRSAKLPVRLLWKALRYSKFLGRCCILDLVPMGIPSPQGMNLQTVWWQDPAGWMAKHVEESFFCQVQLSLLLIGAETTGVGWGCVVGMHIELKLQAGASACKSLNLDSKQPSKRDFFTLSES